MGPRHIWGNARAIVTSVATNRSVGHPNWQKFWGVDVPPTTTDSVVHRGRVTKLSGAITLGLLATAISLGYFIYAFVTTVGMEVSTRIADYNVVEPKEHAMKKQLRDAVKAGQEARDGGISDADVMAQQVSSVTTAHPHEMAFRTVCAPCTTASVRATVTAKAIKEAASVGAQAGTLGDGGATPQFGGLGK